MANDGSCGSATVCDITLESDVTQDVTLDVTLDDVTLDSCWSTDTVVVSGGDVCSPSVRHSTPKKLSNPPELPSFCKCVQWG